MQEEAMFLWEFALSISQGHMNPHRDLENRSTEILFPTFWFLQYDRIRPLKRVTWQLRQAMSRLTLTNLSKSNRIGHFSTLHYSAQKLRQQKPSNFCWRRSMMIMEIFLTPCTSDCTVTREDNFSAKNSRSIVVITPSTRPQHKGTTQMQTQPLNKVWAY